MKIPALMASLFALTSIELASAPLPLEQWQQQGENTLRQQQRFQELQSRLLNEREGSHLSSSQASDRPLELNESPCFVELEGEASDRFQFGYPCGKWRRDPSKELIGQSHSIGL